MKIEVLKVGPVSTNCYRVIGEDKTAAIIDPGYFTEELRAWADESEFPIRAILLTHGHFDHVDGVSNLQEKTGATVYIHQDDVEMLEDPEKNASKLCGCEVFYKGSVTPLQDGDVVPVGSDLKFQLLHTPGHTKGSSIYLIDDVIFSGDTLFYREIGRCDCYGGSLVTMFSSLRKIAKIKGEHKVLPGHGGETDLTTEIKENTYILQATGGAKKI